MRINQEDEDAINHLQECSALFSNLGSGLSLNIAKVPVKFFFFFYKNKIKVCGGGVKMCACACSELRCSLEEGV